LSVIFVKRCKTYKRIFYSLGFPAHCFNIIAVGIKHKPAIIIWIRLRSETRTAIVVSTRRDTSSIEGIDKRSLVYLKRNVGARGIGLSLVLPEVGTP
jgi:hypothetical protein